MKLALLTLIAFSSTFVISQRASAAAQPVYLDAGQSIIVCEDAPKDSNVTVAIAALNARLLKGRDVLSSQAAGFIVMIKAPYSVSSLTITSYQANISDVACVTVTKQ